MRPVSVGALAQEQVRRAFARVHARAFVAERVEVEPGEQRLAAAQQHRRQREVQFVDQACLQILAHRRHAAAEAHVAPAGRLARAFERIVDAAGDEMEAGAAGHVQRRARMLGLQKGKAVPVEERKRRYLVRRAHMATIGTAWVVTVPVSAGLSAGLYLAMIAIAR